MWNKPPAHIILNNKEVHLWYASVEANQSKIEMYIPLLSDDERERADRFYFAKDRNSFITAKAILRILLGKYLKESPANIIFQYGEYNKPEVENQESLKFNISHSGKGILLGFTKSFDIGVDIEKIKNDTEVLDVASNFFSKEEIAFLNQLNDDDKIKGFFNCWTRKESFIKALGSGLSFPLDKFVVSLLPSQEASLLATKWDPEECDKWTLKALEFDDQDYVGAMAIRTKINRVSCWKWNDIDL